MSANQTTRYFRDYKRMVRERRKKAGLCMEVDCGRKRHKDRVRCVLHLVWDAERKKRERRK